MKCVHIAGTVIIDDFVRNDQGTALIRCPKSIHAKTRNELFRLASTEKTGL